MNVDVLVNKPPSIRWYFAAVVPFSALILAVTFGVTRLNKSKREKAQNNGHLPHTRRDLSGVSASNKEQ